MLPFYLTTILVVVFAFVMGNRLPTWIWMLVYANLMLAVLLPTWKAFKRAKASRNAAQHTVQEQERAEQ